MPQIAGFRGALWDPSKVELAKVAGERITGVKTRLANGELVRDPTRALYRYHQTFQLGTRNVTRQTVLAAVRLAPWSEGEIRPHEATDARARDAATAGIAGEGAHTAPVFAGYRDAAREVDRLFRRCEDERPTLELTTPDGTHHKLWRVASAEVMGKVRPLFAPKKLHVLDGHARYEGMLAHAEQIGADRQPQYSSAKFGLACLVNVEDPGLVVAARHRVVRGELDRAAVLDAARAYFIVEPLAGAAKDHARQQSALADTVGHQPAFVLVFAGQADAWKLTLKPDVSPVLEGVAVHRGVQKYEPIVLEHVFFARVAPGTSSVTEVDATRVFAALDGGAPLGVIRRPMTLDQVLHADEVGQTMPFGSTAFLPSLAHLVAFPIDPDEDLA
jgi:hypothetical protein